MGRRAQKWGGGTTQCFRLTGVETEAQKTHMTSPRQLLNVIVPRPRISSNTHHNTFPVLSPLPFHPNNWNIQCSWWAASCCHPSDDHGTSFFLSESNARCYFVPWNITGCQSPEKSMNNYKPKKVGKSSWTLSIWAEAEGHANAFTNGHFYLSSYLTARESNERACSGQCLHHLLLPVWKNIRSKSHWLPDCHWWSTSCHRCC